VNLPSVCHESEPDAVELLRETLPYKFRELLDYPGNTIGGAMSEVVSVGELLLIWADVQFANAIKAKPEPLRKASVFFRRLGGCQPRRANTCPGERRKDKEREEQKERETETFNIEPKYNAAYSCGPATPPSKSKTDWRKLL
jgi:hypothetical protein